MNPPMLRRIAIYSFFVSLPVILYALTMILPTFDDWTYLTAPCFDDTYPYYRYLPWNGYWRPFDALIGTVLGLNYHLFPSLNHCLVLLGHVASTAIIYKLTNQRILPAAFFFLSPGMLGAILDIDSINQVYATLWGLISIMCYRRGCKWLWMACVVIAVFCKENGIMYSVLPLLLDYAGQAFTGKIRPYIKDMAMMLSLLAIYGVARLILAPANGAVQDVYLHTTSLDHLKDIVQYIAFTWLPVDYEAILYPPTRSLLLAAITFVLSVPFLLFLVNGLWRRRCDRALYILMAVYFLAALPHLVTLVSVMHVYAGLPFAALIINAVYVCDAKKYTIAASMFLAASFITDIHHWHGAWQSGLMGKEMAEEIIRKSENNPQKVYVVSVDNGEEKYSSINVIPRDAFGWGRAAQFYSGYTLANEIKDTTIAATSDASKMREIKKIAEEVAKTYKYDALWIVDGKKVFAFEK